MAESLLSCDRQRACLNCGILKTFEEFYQYGCPNCEQFIKFRYNYDRVAHCTTNIYYNLYYIQDVEVKWATCIVPLDRIVIGVYAYFVYGIIPQKILLEVIAREESHRRRRGM